MYDADPIVLPAGLAHESRDFTANYNRQCHMLWNEVWLYVDRCSITIMWLIAVGCLVLVPCDLFLSAMSNRVNALGVLNIVTEILQRQKPVEFSGYDQPSKVNMREKHNNHTALNMRNGWVGLYLKPGHQSSVEGARWSEVSVLHSAYIKGGH